MKDKPRYYSYLRFSSAEQEYGDSIRRQTAMAEKWANEHGVNLDDSLRMEDKGLSAYHQRHLKEDAALGKFMVAIKAGRIPKGSTLIVESNDRLSRAEPKDALFQFMEILRGGCDVVILADNEKRYSWETFDELQMIISIIKASRAHDESKNKSRRVSDAWSAKHDLARKEKKPVTRKIPAWLRLGEAGFEVIEERSAIIRRVFQEALEGDGAEAISRRFNQEGIPPWGTPHKKNRDHSTPVWNKSYITKILTNGAVCGWYTPSKLKGGKRTSQETIKGFYPSVISEELFLEVRAAMKARTIGAGRTGRISNLFPHLCRCGYCGENAQHVNKGKGVKAGHGEFLACSKARVGKGCEYHGLPYLPLEQAFLEYCREINLAALLEHDSRSEDIRQAQSTIDAIDGALTELQGKVDGLMAIIPSMKNATMAAKLAQDLDEAGSEQEALQQRREKAAIRLEALQRSGQAVVDHVLTIQELNSRLEGGDNVERIRIRKNLKHVVARAVKEVIIYPDGLRDHLPAYDPKGGLTIRPFLRHSVDSDGNTIDPSDMELAMLAEHIQQNTGRHAARVLLRFRNGHSRMLRWRPDEKMFVVDSEETADRLVIGGHEF